MVMPVSTAASSHNTPRLHLKTAYIATNPSDASKPGGMYYDEPGIRSKARALQCMQREFCPPALPYADCGYSPP